MEHVEGESPGPQLGMQKRGHGRAIATLCVIVIVLMAGGFGGYLYMQRRGQTQAAQAQASMFAQTKNQVSFPIYVPNKLPVSYQIDPKSITVSSDAVFYAVRSQSGVTVTITNQIKPADVLFEDFYSRVLKNKADVFNNQGKGVVGTAENQTIGSLVTDKVWVLATTTDAIDSQAMTQLVASLNRL